MKKKISLLAIFCYSFFLSYGQIEKIVPPPPQPQRLVNDYTQTLSSAEVESLEHILIAFDDSTSNQVAIVILETIGDYPLEDVAIKILRTWGVGSQKNNGIVLLVVMQDHKIRFEVGSGLEGAIPDMVAASIIDNQISPHFRNGDYYQGFLEGISAIIKVTKGEYEAQSVSKKKSPLPFIIFFIVMILVYFISGRGRNTHGSFSSRGFSVFPSRYSGMGSGSSGGGFGGFGGGFGGGGGASGGW